MANLRVGDTIECHDKKEMVNPDFELAKEGVYCEYLYEMDGKEGLWLVVEKVGEI